jgi:gliding motility-associated-like protein
MDSYVRNPGGLWTGDGIVGNMFDPKVAKASDNKIVYETFSRPTPTLCPDRSTIVIQIVDIPKVVAYASPAGGCAPLEVVFNTPSSNNGAEDIGEWYLGDGSEPKTGLKISHIYTSPGTYSVTLNFRNSVCHTQALVSNHIHVVAAPEANFAFPDEIYISNPTVQLENLTPSIGDNKYTWKIEGLSRDYYDVHPKVEFPKIGRYNVTLIATASNEYQCTSESRKIIEVKNDFNIFIPTSFSPNFDGLNDFFVPVFTSYGLDVKSFEMEIFDRWGHSLYRTRDITKGWDGSINNKGEPMKEEVYVYRIKYRDLEGNSYTKMGHVTLLK